MPPTYPRGMTRSPFTLAASVTQALPGAMVIAAGSLTQNSAGRYDSAVALLADGTKVAVRAPADADAGRELAAETLALRALTVGARSRLGFGAPTVLGEAGLGNARALVVDFLPGYQVDAAYIPAGDGIAPSMGRAIAAIHSLPTSLVRDAGLSSRTPEESRTAVTTLLEHAMATRRLPAALAARWRAAAEDDALWAFEHVVVLGSAGATSFLIEDHESGPGVSGILGWHGLAVDDPALDLHWVASAPEASGDIYAGYAAGAYRTPDSYLHARARMYAELEFAKWLVHGHELHRDDIVEDAVSLLDGLVASVLNHQQPPLTAAPADLDVAAVEDLLNRVPLPTTSAAETSFQTDAYNPDMLSLFEASELERANEALRSQGGGSTAADAAAPAPAEHAMHDPDGETGVIELDADLAPGPGVDTAVGAHASAELGDPTASSEFDNTSTAPVTVIASDTPVGSTGAHTAGDTDTEDDDEFAGEADRASQAAFRRWGAKP